jgi:hypothetical protein
VVGGSQWSGLPLLIALISALCFAGLLALLVVDLDMGQAIAIYAPTYLLALAIPFLIGLRWGRRVAFTVTLAVAVALVVLYVSALGLDWTIDPILLTFLIGGFVLLPWGSLAVAGASLRTSRRS